MSEQELQPEGADVPVIDADTGEGVEDVAKEPETESSTEGDTPKKKPWFNERIDELTANWRQTERDRDYERQERMRLQAELEAARQGQMPKTSGPASEPKSDDYSTYEEYIAALADFKADQKIQQWQQTQEEQKTQAERQRLEGEYSARERQFAASTPDYDQVAHDPYLPVSEAMAEVIRQSENGPELLYQLGKQREEASRIANLPPTMAAMEMGRFAAKLSMPQAKLNSAAPDPIEPIGGGDGGTITDPAKAKSMADYVRLRNSK